MSYEWEDLRLKKQIFKVYLQFITTFIFATVSPLCAAKAELRSMPPFYMHTEKINITATYDAEDNGILQRLAQTISPAKTDLENLRENIPEWTKEILLQGIKPVPGGVFQDKDAAESQDIGINSIHTPLALENFIYDSNLARKNATTLNLKINLSHWNADSFTPPLNHELLGFYIEEEKIFAANQDGKSFYSIKTKRSPTRLISLASDKKMNEKNLKEALRAILNNIAASINCTNRHREFCDWD